MQLIARVVVCCVLLTFVPAQLFADDTEVNGAARTGLYLDSDHTTIITAETDASARFDAKWQVGARYLLDVVSSASIDVVTQASDRFDDTRHDIGANVGYRNDDGTSLIANYSYSVEHDWVSHNAGVSGTVDLLDRNLSLGLSLGVQDNTITRANTYGFEEKLAAYLATASATYTASPKDLIHVALSLSLYDGFQASPYRYLTIRQFGYAENVPDSRVRAALVGRYHRYLGGGFASRSHVRLYTDSYNISALTAGTELVYEKEAFDLSGWLRGYAQTNASFYQQVYADQQRYMSIDKEMSNFMDVFLGITGGWNLREPTPLKALRLEARVAANYFYYVNFARLQERYGLTATLSIAGNL